MNLPCPTRRVCTAKPPISLCAPVHIKTPNTSVRGMFRNLPARRTSSLSDSLPRTYSLLSFSHPDFTVGYGISPYQPLCSCTVYSRTKSGSRTLPPVGNLTLPRRFVILFTGITIARKCLKIKGFFTFFKSCGLNLFFLNPT